MAKPDPAISAIFRRPFPEQVAAFRLRLGNLVATSSWDDVWQDGHDRSFMVAGATKADLLSDLAAAVDKAVAEGTSLEEFRRDFRKIVERRGWHGWTGEGTKAGEAWRTRVIYRTNARTSYAAGRLAQLREGNFAYWIYRHGGSLEPRPEHLAWDRIALPPDHPFWETHATPNGWGCSCYIVGARTRAGIRRMGGDPDKVLPEGWQKLDPKTGAPRGIDRGWAYAPGNTVSDTVTALRPKLNDLPPQPSIDLIRSWLQEGPFAKWMEAPKGAWPLVRISGEDAARIGARREVADLSAETALKQLRQHPELTPAEYVLAQDTVSRATYRIQDTPQSMIYLLDEPSGYLLVVKATRTGKGLFVTSFRRITGDATRRAQLIRQFRRRE
ncbi:phage minor head protein [Chachezhania antarctica]|uniref:phage head morphogenesis protein n=1 Tax=Chachezhania antarctica TaxID=2340860 RepID=UPI000EAF1E65|nr:phage minor head protein [Chachezhania antarctica]|tara:strand:- start:322 stop:1476 length:1155 start_codon:yes stop_codon:yes gene_type:complete